MVLGDRKEKCQGNCLRHYLHGVHLFFLKFCPDVARKAYKDFHIRGTAGTLRLPVMACCSISVRSSLYHFRDRTYGPAKIRCRCEVKEENEVAIYICVMSSLKPQHIIVYAVHYEKRTITLNRCLFVIHV